MKSITHQLKLLRYLVLLVLLGCGSGSDSGSGDNPSSGLDGRPNNLACTAFNIGGGTTVALTEAFPNLVFNQPVALIQHPVDDQRWYVVEQPGRVQTFREGDTSSSEMIDLSAQVTSGGEAGLLGMAFHPDFSTNGEIYLSYTGPGSPLVSHISRVISTDDGLTADPGSEALMLSVDQPYGNHNGGWIDFGQDGFLYIGLGDGGSRGDPDDNGQDITTLLGAMLRIDVDSDDPTRGTPYAIPSGNPFGSNLDCTSGCPEIFAWGFRNIWRWSFDQLTNTLWAGDVGQDTKEEIDLVSVGNNYGWVTMEGADCYPPGASCSTVGLTQPVWDYGRSEGSSVTGGYVYRGATLTALYGAYIYGDFGSGNIWQLSADGPGSYTNELLLRSGLNIAAFGQSRDGEMYVVSYGDGQIYSLGQAASTSVPQYLSDTGYVQAGDATMPVDCFIPYDINAPFWSDGADKERYFAIPNGTFIDISGADNWQFPSGSVTLKSFWLNGEPVETRLLMRLSNGQWAGYSYEWDDTEDDFVRVIGGKTKDVAGQTWIYPSESDCMNCHPAAAGRTLGLETRQLNRAFTYPATGRTANQLTTYEAISLITPDLPDTADQLPALPDPFNSPAPLMQRAKAYLHTNCAQCHRPSGPTPSTMDLRFQTPFTEMNLCDAPVQGTTLNITDPRLIIPGDPDRSMVLQRMQRRDVDGMPPLGSSLVDTQGADLVEQWIIDLPPCP